MVSGGWEAGDIPVIGLGRINYFINHINFINICHKPAVSSSNFIKGGGKLWRNRKSMIWKGWLTWQRWEQGRIEELLGDVQDMVFNLSFVC